MLSPGLSESEMRFRDLFVREYLKDFDALAAVIRMGFMAQYAPDYAKRMMFCWYVRQQLSNAEESDDYTATPEVQKRQVFKLLKREATYQGAGSTHGARVQALGKLADFLGMNAPLKTVTDVNLSGGVQFYIPHNGRESNPAQEQP